MAYSHRKARAHALAFDAITVEGALIAPAMLARVAALSATDQTPTDYGVPKGLAIRDEIARYFRMGQALFAELAVAATPSHRATVDFAQALLRDIFGFVDVTRTEPKLVGERRHPITFEMLGGRVPVVVVQPQDEFDRPSVTLSEDGRRRSAASTMQDWLNAEESALWGLALNGDHLRLMRDNTSFTRPAFIEADLRHIFQDEAFSDFTALWLLIHASRFGQAGAPITDCPLERWRDAGAREGEVARERLRDGVELALLALGNGFLAHSENVALRVRLGDGTLPTTEFFGQLLRLVYRLIFLFAAEDRDLLHIPATTATVRKLYAEGYSLGRLRDRAVKRRYRDTYYDQWEGLLIVFSALARGEPKLGLPALDGLFARGTLPDLEAAHLANRDLMEAIYSLAWLKDTSGPVAVNWRDMQTEELGSVYESLLELTPQLANEARKFTFAQGAETKGNARKTSGSYYTPDSLVQTLLDSALDPVLDRVTAETDDPTKALLSVTVIDPACGSGHFLLAAARRIAIRLAKLRAGGLASPEDFRHALRDVVRACIHGVDRNPMAVELARVALWIETVDPGKPLGFLDANVRCGDSLFGLFDLKALEEGIPDPTYKPLTGDDKDTAKCFEKRNKEERKGQGELDFGGGGGKLPPAAPLADAARALRALPEDSPQEIAAKRKRFEAARAEPRSRNLRIAADLYTAAFLSPKTGGPPGDSNAVMVPTTAHVWDALAGHSVQSPLVGNARDLSGAARAFHWPLEFPDVMASGGFDVVLGNPPWEVMQLGEEEYFAQREPEIAELKGAARKRAIASLATERAEVFRQYEFDKRQFDAGNQFARASGRFKLTAQGKINAYSLFAELAATLVDSRGRVGLVLPLGIATNETTAAFFADLVNNKRLVALLSMAEIKEWFAGTKDNQSFCLFTIGHSETAEFAFRLEGPSHLADPQRRFTLSISQISRINPNTKTAPVFRTRRDAELTAKIYARTTVLIEEAKGKVGNPWELEFRQGLFNMTSDSRYFRTAAQLRGAGFVRMKSDWIYHGDHPAQDAPDLDRRAASPFVCDGTHYLPLFESKMFSFFDSRFGYYPDGSIDDTRALPRPTAEQQCDPNWFASPRFWVDQTLVDERVRAVDWHYSWLFAFRKITNTTNERTLISSVTPMVGIGDSTYVVFSRKPAVTFAALICAFSTIVVDFVARQKMGGTNLNLFHLFQFPILPPSAFTRTELDFIVQRILELTYTSHSMAPFARDLGYDGPPFAWNEDRRAALRAELDAWYARAYGLTRDELRYILDPADVMGADYPSETFRVLKKNEIAKYGEYRTARLVLEAWDAMERGEAREASPPIEIVTPSPASIELATLPDGAWARPGTLHPGDVGAAATAILKMMVGAKPIRDVRLTAAFVLEPRLLVPLLSKSDALDWRRLVGLEADPLPANVTAFATRVNASWGTAVANLRGNRRLIENLKSGTWSAGLGLDAIETSGWPEGRARFVLDALTKLDLGTITKSLPSEIQRWIADVAAA